MIVKKPELKIEFIVEPIYSHKFGFNDGSYKFNNTIIINFYIESRYEKTTL